MLVRPHPHLTTPSCYACTCRLLRLVLPISPVTTCRPVFCPVLANPCDFSRAVIDLLALGSWGDWTECLCSNPQQTRTYTIYSVAVNGGAPCPSKNGDKQTQPCQPIGCPVDCVGDWSGGTLPNIFNHFGFFHSI